MNLFIVTYFSLFSPSNTRCIKAGENVDVQLFMTWLQAALLTFQPIYISYVTYSYSHSRGYL